MQLQGLSVKILTCPLPTPEIIALDASYYSWYIWYVLYASRKTNAKHSCGWRTRAPASFINLFGTKRNEEKVSRATNVCLGHDVSLLYHERDVVYKLN